MFHNDYIRLSLNLKDPNITFAEKACVEQKIKGVTATLYFATLTYIPTHCNCCDRENTDFLIVKNGFLTSRVKWLHLANRPAYIELKKQRFLCRKCKRTFVAQSEEVAPSCFIANKVKQSLAIELGDAISLKDLSRRHNVSPTTTERILTQLGAAFKVDYTYLPPNLSLDEFKSVKNVVGKMSFIYCDSVTHEIIDILPDRRLNGLREYFSRFSLEARQQVKTIVVDMNAAYFTLACELFPNAEVIIDRFHVVQLISRSLNQTRIQIMKQFFGSNASKMKDYRKLKNYWRLMLKCSTELDFQTYNYQRLFKKPLPETEIIDYLVSLDPVLKATYTTYQELLYYSKNNDFQGFKATVTQANPDVSNVMSTSLKTLKKHLSRIKNTFQYSYSNGPLEGSINKIKVIKRIAYGYRNFSNFKHRILISFKVTQKSNFTISDEAA
ncbi:ISL3 family transposase [Vagococcus salmoninarum]|uniref:ISL3 family transposase n=1 Tax=Vagococcus salmoninarum TaxID=2739 RepID=UPI00398AB566